MPEKKREPSYTVRGINLSNIRNTLEMRVAALMEQALGKYPEYTPDSYDIQDIYALALNSLPARYKQSGTIELTGKLPDEDVLAAIERALVKVRAQPTFPQDKR